MVTARLGQEIPLTEIKEGTVLAEETGDRFGATVSEVRRKPVTLYNTRTLQAVEVNYWNAGDALKKLHRDRAYPKWIGKPVFTRGIFDPETQTYKAPGVPKRGRHLCLLHPDRPEWPELERDGFPACATAHIPSEADVRSHMQKRHKAEWARMEDIRKERERRETMALQREQIQAFTRLVGVRSLPAARTPKPVIERCLECDFTAESTRRAAALNKVKAHQKRRHPRAT